jgi:hypothetical protein
MYEDEKKRWYIRIIDIVDVLPVRLAPRERNSKMNLIANFVGMWNPSDTRNSVDGCNLLRCYQEYVKDPEAPMSHINNVGKKGNIPKVAGWYIVFEAIPYVLKRFGLQQCPNPTLERLWGLMMAIPTIPGASVDAVRGPNKIRPKKVKGEATVVGDRDENSDYPEEFEVEPEVLTGPPAEMQPVPDTEPIVEEKDDTVLSQKPIKQLVQTIRRYERLQAAERERWQLASEKIRKENSDLRKIARDSREEAKKLEESHKVQQAFTDLARKNDESQDLPIPAGEFRKLTEIQKLTFLGHQHRRHLKTQRAFSSLEKKYHSVKLENEQIRKEWDIRSKIRSEAEVQTDDFDGLRRLQEENRTLTARLAIPLIGEVDRLTARLPANRGRIGEDEVYNMLKDAANTNDTILITRSVPHHADFMIIYRDKDSIKGYAIIDAKHYEKAVGGDQVAKLEKDITECTTIYGCPPIWAAIVSLESSISHTGVSHAPDYFFGDTRVRLIHNLRHESSGGICGILLLLEKGELDVQAAFMRMCHRRLPEEVVFTRNTALTEIEKKVKLCTDKSASSHGRSLSASTRQKRLASMHQMGQPVNVRFEKLVEEAEPDEESDGDIKEGGTMQILSHINQVLKFADLTEPQQLARDAILEIYEFNPVEKISKGDLINCIIQARNIHYKTAAKILSSITISSSCNTRNVFGLTLKVKLT